MKQLRLIKRDKLDYIVPTPMKNQGVNESKIRIAFEEGEYVYLPRRYTFLRGTIMTSKELKLIVKELDRLNKEE